MRSPRYLPGDDARRKSENQELVLRGLGEYSKQSPDKSLGLCEPFPKNHTLVDGWKRGDLIFHLKIGLRTRLPSRDATKFCADLKYSPTASCCGLGDFGVPNCYRFPSEDLGKEENGLKRPVFVEIVQFRKNDQGVKVPVSLGVSIRLSATDDCAICAPNARQASGAFTGTGEAFIEVLTRLGDRERDCSSLALIQRRGRGTAARDDRPGEIVQGASVVVGDRTEPQSEPGWRRGHMVEREDEPVTLRVVVTPHGVQPLKVLVVDKLREVSFQSFGFSYRPAPLEPSAVEQARHEEESTMNPVISPNPPRPRLRDWIVGWWLYLTGRV